MSMPFAIAIYFVIWWTVLFAMLPIGVRTQDEDGAIVPGTPASAPTRPRLLRAMLLTTLVSALVFGGLWLAVRYGLIDLGQLLGAFGAPKVRTDYPTGAHKRKEQGRWALLERLPILLSKTARARCWRVGRKSSPDLGSKAPA